METAKNTIQVYFEMTDTFGGEANYSWVCRHTETARDNVSDIALVRRAKKWAGWSGFRARVENLGDTIAIYPAGLCQVLFITFCN